MQPTSFSNSKFWGPAFSDDEDEEVTHKRPIEEPISPDVSPNKVTPKKIKTLELALYQEFDPLSDLTKKEHTIIQEGVKTIKQLRSPTKQVMAKRILTAAKRRLVPDEDLRSARTHNKAIETLEDCMWMQRLLTDVSNIHPNDEAIINVQHLTKPDQGQGLHFCPLASEFRKFIIDISINEKTAVWSGYYDGKFSTFFPDWVENEDHLVDLIQKADLVRREGNHLLKKVGNDLYIEVFSEYGGSKVNTAFPLFCFEQYEENRTYEITPKYRISSRQALDAALSHQANVRFTDEDTTIVDIAPALDTAKNIPKGIYFVFSNEKLY